MDTIEIIESRTSLLTVEELGEYTSISPKTLYRYIKNRNAAAEGSSRITRRPCASVHNTRATAARRGAPA